MKLVVSDPKLARMLITEPNLELLPGSIERLPPFPMNQDVRSITVIT